MATEARAPNSLNDVLLRRRAVSESALREAAEEAKSSNVRLEHHLVKTNRVSGAQMVLALAEYLDLPPIALGHFTPNAELLASVPPQWLAHLQAVPVQKVGDLLFVAVADPFNINGLDMLHTLTGLEIQPMVAQEREVAEILEKFGKEPAQSLDDILRDVGEGEVEVGREQNEDISLDAIKEIAEEAPVIRIVNSIMVEALRKRASDIHVEPMEKALRLRYRVDGVLYENPSPPKRLHPAICSRIKILSNLNIAERRVPQDGRFKIRAMGREADVRVSILPTVHGEKVVMRILDKSALAPSLSALGLDPVPTG